MKRIFKTSISSLNWLFIYLFTHGFLSKGSSFFLAKCNIEKTNHIYFSKSRIEHVRISVKGSQNEIKCNNSFISNSSIQIKGTDNRLCLEPGVKLRNAKIQIRGNNLTILIGEYTSFGGVRIVNVGRDNDIKIGKNCLFADHIEIWASDTHSIYDKDGKMINLEKPIDIGDHVWVGSHVIILKGVHINEGSVIGMGSLVTKDVPSYVISTGRPNVVIRENIHWKLDYF